MRSFDDPATMTPHERLSEVAGIFAAGILRLHARAALPTSNLGSEESRNSAPTGLELSDETVLSVHCG
ncbi:MAG: hypothetical protein RBS80_22010 [Thermoguttaceae bacterium]|jgi:hypothetical protein|nr:hypothetical protein [Thermoguttaceae bacterium]